MEKKSGNIFKKILYIVLLFAVVWICYEMMNSGSSGKEIDISDFQNMLENQKTQEITDVYAVGGKAYVRKVGSEIKPENFPKFADYYFTYTNSESLDNLILRNEKVIFKVNYKAEVPSEPFISQIMPFLSIGVVLVIGFMLFKMMANNNKGAMSFGKSRVKLGESSKVRFSDVAGADEEKDELKEIVEFLKNPQKFTDLGARIPKGVLLVGPPGTGKTLLARAVAGESNVPFFSISGSDFVEMFVGVGAARVRDLFDNAKKEMPCIVFIDEIDAVGRQRGTGMGGGNDEREQTLNQLLVEMDGFGVNDGIIVLAATNRSDVLDPALTRPGRFDRQIYVHVPDVKGRESIMKIHAKNKPLDDDINFKTLARITTGFTGADIENMLNEAAILAARAGRAKIIMADLTEGINKVIMGPQKKSRLVTERDRKITAYHEAGHAILGAKLKNCDQVQEVSIIPRGMAGGYTMSRPDNDDSYLTFNKICDSIAMTMGGRIAEDIIFKDISTGASGDICQATDMARKMVTEWGMSKKLGFVNLGSSNEPFLGREYQEHSKYSEKVAGEIDAEIKSIIDENYKRAYKILSENGIVLEEMANLLLQKETIYQDEVDMLLSGKTADEVAAHMTLKEEEEKKKQDAAKKESEDLKKNKEVENKIKTAEALVKAGVITKEEFEKIKENGKATIEKEHKEEKPKEKQDDLKEEKPEEEKPEAAKDEKSIKAGKAEKKALKKSKKNDEGSNE